MTDEVRMLEMQEQQKDLHAIIARFFSASRMSTNKWRKLTHHLNNVSATLAVKFVDKEKVYPLHTFWHVTGDWFDSSPPGPFPGLAVEWLTIKPNEASGATELEHRLQAIRVPYYWEGDCIRIVGHVRNQQA